MQSVPEIVAFSIRRRFVPSYIKTVIVAAVVLVLLFCIADAEQDVKMRVFKQQVANDLR